MPPPPRRAAPTGLQWVGLAQGQAASARAYHARVLEVLELELIEARLQPLHVSRVLCVLRRGGLPRQQAGGGTAESEGEGVGTGAGSRCTSAEYSTC